MVNNALIYPFPSRRTLVYGGKGMAAASQPLAAQAGLDTLKAGGNAADAAAAMGMALTVLEPTANGIGGDAFCILWHEGRLYGLNASGTAPRAISAAKLKERGYDRMPVHGFASVTVPGAPSAWAALSKRFGRLPLVKAAEPAITYAEEGYPVSPGVAEGWLIAVKAYKKRLDAGLFRHFCDTFTFDGEPPKPGQLVRLPAHARTLGRIAESGGDEFYKYGLADAIDAYFGANGGFLCKDDLAGYSPEWVEPISARYAGYDVWEIPPNGQGIVALMALNILDGMERVETDSPMDWHRKIEAVKLAFTEGFRHIADPAFMRAGIASLLSKELAAARRALITDRAVDPAAVPFHDHGTVYCCAGDRWGNMVSYIQSNYMGFGSGVVVPGTGIAMQNRGANFTLEDGHPNRLEPGKRPYHTIIPGFLTRDGQAVGPFGIMGGFMQPQAHVQVLCRMLDAGQNPQAALDAPRWQWLSGKRVQLESSSPGHMAGALRQLGHETEYAPSSTTFGRGQIICRLDNGVYTGATEPRADGTVAAW